jgi:hypothetical protein
MTRIWLIIVAAVFALATVDAAFAGKKHRHGTRYRAPAPVVAGHAPAYGPARMIEVRPGLFISSYDCVTDEGYGRFSPCSATNTR